MITELDQLLDFEYPIDCDPDTKCAIVLHVSAFKQILIDPLQLHKTVVAKPDFDSLTITDTYNNSYTINVTHDAYYIHWTIWTNYRKTPIVYKCLRHLYLKTCIKYMSQLQKSIADKELTAYPKQQLSEFRRKLWNKKFVAYGLNCSEPDTKTEFAYGMHDFQFKTDTNYGSTIWYHIQLGSLEYYSAIEHYQTFSSLRNQLEHAVYNRGEECHLRFIYEYCGESTYIDYKDGFVYITHCELHRCNDIIAYVGGSFDIIKSIYCKLLFYALNLWAQHDSNWRPDGEVLYNQIKSSVVEKYLQHVCFYDDDISFGNTDRNNHVLRMQGGNRGLVDECGNEYSIDNDTIVLDRLVRRPLAIKIDGLSFWLSQYNPDDLFSLRVWWFSKGEKYMRMIKKQLPADIDLWFAPAEGSEWTFFPFANLYMTKQKTCRMRIERYVLHITKRIDLLNLNEHESAMRYIGQHNHSCTRKFRQHPTFELAFDKSTPITKVSICCKNCCSSEDITDYSSWSV